MPEGLVYIDEYGLLGSNYYYQKSKDYGITEGELHAAGVDSDRLQVSLEIIQPLKNVDEIFKAKGYRLYIKDGYRPVALYDVVYEKRSKRFGQEVTDRLVNMKDKPHSTGKTVDVTLWDEQMNQEVPMRDKSDGVEALFLNYYKNGSDEKSNKFQELQDFVIETMLNNGFKLGPKGEYFHFNYDPHSSK